MVCEDCQKKSTKLACPEKYDRVEAAGAKKAGGGGGGGGGGGMMPAAGKSKTNKLLGANSAAAFLGAKPLNNCRICKSKLREQGQYYCLPCAHKKGICTHCGKKCVDVSAHKMSSV